MDWTLLTTGKFYSSGSIYYDKSDDMYKDSRMNSAMNPEIRNSLYDTVSLSGDKYKYKSDDDAYLYVEDSSLRVGLDKAVAFLKSTERDFILSAFDRAKKAYLTYCDSMFSSFAIISPPGTRVPSHRHSNKNNLTFTYIVSSLESPQGNSFIHLEDDNYLMYPHDTREFFCLIDTSLNHGTRRHSDDINTYIFFVFDGITLKSDVLELHKIYKA